MRAALKSLMDLDLVFIFGEQGETATIQSQSNVPVVASARNHNQQNDDMGIMPMANVQLTVRTAALTVTPAIGGIVSYAGKTLRISNIQHDQDGNALVLQLIDDSQ
jgi:hypothetical protein